MSKPKPVKKGAAFLRQALRRCRQALTAAIVFSFVINLLMLTASLYSLQLFDRVLTSRSIDTLLYLSLLALIAFGIQCLLDLTRSQVMTAIGTWIDERLGPSLYAGGVAGHAPVALGPAATQPLRDLGQLRNFLVGPHLSSFFDAPWAPVLLLLLFFLHTLIGAIALVGAIVLLGLAFLNEYWTKVANERAAALTAESIYDSDVAVRNADAIRAMGMMPALAERWNARNALAIGYVRHAALRGNVITSLSRTTRQVLQAAVLGVGAWLTLKNELTSGALIASTILVSRALAPVEMAIAASRQAIAARQSYRRIGTFLEASEVRGADATVMEPKGRIAVDNVIYVHPGQREPTLRGVSFALEPGESVAILGPSGSGKTTLMRLLVGALKPSAGAVRFDGIDMTAWDGNARGSFVGYLPQTVELFRGTVEENIARMRTTVPAMVVRAAEMARAHDFIHSLPRGYQTPIGDGGLGLSGGQTQRIGLARALFAKPLFVVLDEPNAHLDQQAEMALHETLREMKEKGMTAVIVTHRQNLLEFVDKLLILREGQVAAFGPRRDVLARLAAQSGVQRMQAVKPGAPHG